MMIIISIKTAATTTMKVLLLATVSVCCLDKTNVRRKYDVSEDGCFHLQVIGKGTQILAPVTQTADGTSTVCTFRATIIWCENLNTSSSRRGCFRDMAPICAQTVPTIVSTAAVLPTYTTAPKCYKLVHWHWPLTLYKKIQTATSSRPPAWAALADVWMC
jgi:hypothetical protein